MSDTRHRREYSKHRVQGRANPYGLCPCGECRSHRNKYGASIQRMKHKFRTSWKTGKQFIKGLYTD